MTTVLSGTQKKYCQTPHRLWKRRGEDFLYRSQIKLCAELSLLLVCYQTQHYKNVNAMAETTNVVDTRSKRNPDETECN